MRGGKNDKKKKDPPPKLPFAPEREPIVKPELTPEEELEELKKSFQDKGAIYFSGTLEEKISNIITLFSRTEEELVTFSELKEILIATNCVSTYKNEKLLLGLFDLLKESNSQKVDSLSRRSVYLILTKKFKDNDKKKDIIEAFEFINSDEPKKPVVEENTISEEQMIKSAFFYDKLIYNGYKYTDEMADVVLKQADPKNKTEFGYEKFTDHILKTVKKKKKRVTKKKK